MCAGLGREALAVLSTLLALVILAVLPSFERRMAARHPQQPSDGDANTRDPTPRRSSPEEDER